MKTANCHPEQKHYALGKCKKCYHSDIAKTKTFDYWKAIRLKVDFGLTLEQYEEMLRRQNGVCAICHKPPKSKQLAVDHNHKTAVIRGLLCPSCNRVVGYLDNQEWMSAANKYLTCAQSRVNPLQPPF